MKPLKVLLTGSNGRIGPHFKRHFAERYELRCFDLKPNPDDPTQFVGDLQDIAVLKQAMDGIDVVVHLAAVSDEAPFLEKLVPHNVVGLYNTFQAAFESGVRRIVFASTCQVMAAHDFNSTILPLDYPRPNTMYGATKAMGEILGRWYHDKHKMEFIAVRIGFYQDYDSSKFLNDHKKNWLRKLWLSPADAVQLFTKAIELQPLGFAIVHGTSICDGEFLSLQSTRELLGYQPQDSFLEHIAKIKNERIS